MIIKIILLFLAFAIIILYLLQEDKTDGIMSLTSGSNLRLFQNAKERGTEKALTIATAVVGTLFMILVAVTAFI